MSIKMAKLKICGLECSLKLHTWLFACMHVYIQDSQKEKVLWINIKVDSSACQQDDSRVLITRRLINNNKAKPKGGGKNPVPYLLLRFKWWIGFSTGTRYFGPETRGPGARARCPFHKPSSPCPLAHRTSPAAPLSSCKHLIRLMHSAQAENSIYHSYSNEFPLRWQLQPHHVRKTSQPLPFTEHTHTHTLCMQKMRPVCAVFSSTLSAAKLRQKCARLESLQQWVKNICTRCACESVGVWERNNVPYSN